MREWFKMRIAFLVAAQDPEEPTTLRQPLLLYLLPRRLIGALHATDPSFLALRYLIETTLMISLDLSAEFDSARFVSAVIRHGLGGVESQEGDSNQPRCPGNLTSWRVASRSAPTAGFTRHSDGTSRRFIAQGIFVQKRDCHVAIRSKTPF
jgi:hypothetical protein